MARSRETKIELTAYDDLFQTDESREEAKLSKGDVPTLVGTNGYTLVFNGQPSDIPQNILLERLKSIPRDCLLYTSRCV